MSLQNISKLYISLCHNWLEIVVFTPKVKDLTIEGVIEKSY